VKFRARWKKVFFIWKKKNGVNLAYYWKIPVKEKQLKEAKQVGLEHAKRIKQNTEKGIYLELLQKT
jgi:hypothetical protein